MPKWDEMAARQRDVAIGQRLGLHLHRPGTFYWYDDGEDKIELPHYTTDPAAALQLAEAMREKGWGYMIEAIPGGFAKDWQLSVYEAVCEWLVGDGQDKEYRASADTLAEAIAHAAFITLGGEE